MEINWKFQVGQIVQFKAMGSVWRMAKQVDKYAVERTMLAMINARFAEECAGGTQLLYRVRLYSENGLHLQTVDVHEHELGAVEEITAGANNATPQAGE